MVMRSVSSTVGSDAIVLAIDRRARAWFLPQTWVYHLCRLAMLTNPSLTNPVIYIQFLKGLVFAIVLFPIGYKTFQWGLMRAKREGTLGHY